MIVILPCLMISLIAVYTLYSLSASKAEVASSNINIFGFLINALAIETLYFYPPDSLIPLSPTIVLNPSGNYSLSTMNYRQLAYLHASYNCFLEYSLTP